jgi:hypothetical protein
MNALGAPFVMPKKAFALLLLLPQLLQKLSRRAAIVMRRLLSRDLAGVEMRYRIHSITVHDLVLDTAVLLQRRQLHGHVARLFYTVTGSKMRHLEEISSYCHASMWELTRGTAPLHGAKIQRRIFDAEARWANGRSTCGTRLSATVPRSQCSQ